MRQLSQELAEREARRAAFARSDPTSYNTVLNRYLSAQGYAAAPDRTPPVPATRRVPARTGGAESVVPRQCQAVVVGVDGSPTSYAAVDHAAVEAELRGWEIRLVHVQHPTRVRRAMFEQRDRGAALLSEMGERVRSRVSTVPVGTALRVGSLTDILVAESASAGLMVLGNRGYGTVAGLLAPSLSLHLAAHAAGPVLIVRVPAWPPGQGWADRPVVVGVDGSPGGAAALEFALGEAKLRGGPLLAVHATRGPAPLGGAREPLAHGLLADAGERLDGVRVRRRAVAADPVEALVAASAHASAVVVGARGHNTLGPALPGAVSRALIHRAHCPVFIVPEPGRRHHPISPPRS